MMREKVSAPITRMVRACPVRISASAVATAYMNPAQTAWTSKAKPPAPIACCTWVAVAGKVLSGVAVARMIASTSGPSIPASSSAARAALIARCEVSSPSAAKCRRSMPVRARIHSSDVSRNFVNSSFSTTRFGR